MKELTKNKLISILKGTLFPSLYSIELEKNSITDFQYRFVSKYPNIAELFHENSKLNEYTSKCIVTDEEIIKEAKNWYLATTCKVREEDIDREEAEDIFKNIETLPQNLTKLFVDFSKEGKEAEWLYNVDLLLLYKHKVYKYIPLTKYLLLEKKIGSKEMGLLETWIIEKGKDPLERTLGLIFLVGIPWRNMVLYGPRGYRNMLIETGCLIHHLSQVSFNNGLDLVFFKNFYDNKINRLLNLDGVEGVTLTIISILGKEGGIQDEGNKKE